MNPEPVTDILTLEGSGYSIAVSAEIESKKNDLVLAATAITRVSSNEESASAQFQIRGLAEFRNLVEKSRVAVKKPVLDLGKKIDKAASDFVDQIVGEETRLKKLVGAHAATVLEAKRKAEEEERRKIDEARRAAEEAERAKREAEEAKAKEAGAKTISEVIAAKQAARTAEEVAAEAEQERRAAVAERFDASTVVAVTRVAEGVRFEPDFEVADITRLYIEVPHLVEMSARRRETLAWLKAQRDAGVNIEELGERVGLVVTLKPVVSTR